MTPQPTPTGSSDPVEQRADGWWFWEESWAFANGPYATEAEARAALRRYCVEELGE